MCIDKKHKNKIKMNLLIHKLIFKISRMQQSVRGGYVQSLRCSPHGGCGFHNKPHTDILWWHEKLHAWCFRVRHQPILFIYLFTSGWHMPLPPLLGRWFLCAAFERRRTGQTLWTWHLCCLLPLCSPPPPPSPSSPSLARPSSLNEPRLSTEPAESCVQTAS